MTAIITGDIKNSRQSSPQTWLKHLKEAMSFYGKEPSQWEIFRGDSFQLETHPEKALEAVMTIKSAIKKTKGLDVRAAIGLGNVSYRGKGLTESNGSAFIHSGECFEKLKKNGLAIETPWDDLNKKMNIMFLLANRIMEEWAPKSAAVFQLALEHPKVNQATLASMAGVGQSNISRGLKRAGFDELNALNIYYISEIKKLCYPSS